MRDQTTRSKPAVALAFALVALSSRAAHADPPPSPPRSLYRIEVTITGLEDGAHPAPATYSLVLQENQSGMVSTGANVPLVTGSGSNQIAARQDVGLNLRLSYSLRGETVLLSGQVEMSSVDAATGASPAVIHRMRADGVVAVAPGAPAVLASVYDLGTHRRCEVTVAARRLL